MKGLIVKKHKIGIRLEDKSFESRTPLIPSDIKDFLEMQRDRFEIFIQQSRGNNSEVYEEKKALEFIDGKANFITKRKKITQVPRCFNDESYLHAGVQIAPNLSNCSVILGIKEIPISEIEPGKTYVFFSHTYKGQSYNQKMFEKLKVSGCTLIDYEMIIANFSSYEYNVARDIQANAEIRAPFEALRRYRTVFFGKHAGIVGAINCLWLLGKRLNEDKKIKTPFLKLKQALSYYELDKNKPLEVRHEKDHRQVQAYNSAKKDIEAMAREITLGLPKGCPPIVIGITGMSKEKGIDGLPKFGRSALGAKEVIDILRPEVITPEQLRNPSTVFVSNKVYVVYFDNTHTTAERADFSVFLPKLTVLINCMTWDESLKRIVTIGDIRKLYTHKNHDLIIGDVTCDPGGSIEMSLDVDSASSHYLYDPSLDDSTDRKKYVPDEKGRSGWQHELQRDYLHNEVCCFPNIVKGAGPVIMSVTNLPCEFPGEASRKFSKMLWPYIDDIAKVHGDKLFEELEVCEPVKRAILLYKGNLTPDYNYLQDLYKGQEQ